MYFLRNIRTILIVLLRCISMIATDDTATVVVIILEIAHCLHIGSAVIVSAAADSIAAIIALCNRSYSCRAVTFISVRSLLPMNPLLEQFRYFVNEYHIGWAPVVVSCNPAAGYHHIIRFLFRKHFFVMLPLTQADRRLWDDFSVAGVAQKSMRQSIALWQSSSSVIWLILTQ